MELKVLEPDEVHASSVRALGLDSEMVDLTMPEALAASVRRAASFLCPCAPRTLQESVVQTLDGLVHDDEIGDRIDQIIEDLIGYGDLQEHQVEQDGRKRTLLYASPPSFVPRNSGGHLILGIAPQGVPIISEALQQYTRYDGHARRLVHSDLEQAVQHLKDLGLRELDTAQWLKVPPQRSPVKHRTPYDQALDATSAVVDLPSLTIIDPQADVTYYSGRWREPKDSDRGRFIGRRPQAYGADLWCYVEVEDGSPKRLLDLPTTTSRGRGCDEAWHLQAALDAENGIPQVYRVSSGVGNQVILEFFSPIPAWAKRRLDAIGTPIPRDQCLFAYALPKADQDDEIDFLRDYLWMVDRDRS